MKFQYTLCMESHRLNFLIENSSTCPKLSSQSFLEQRLVFSGLLNKATIWLIKLKQVDDCTEVFVQGTRRWCLCNILQFSHGRLSNVIGRRLVQCIKGDTVSKGIKIDYKTGRGTRGCFARMAVCRGLNRPLISKIFIKDNIQQIEC